MVRGLSWAAAGGGASSLVDLSDVLLENDSIWIGSDPSAITNEARYNLAVGINTLSAITTGDKNVAVGYEAGLTLTEGENNVILGHGANPSNSSASNQIVGGGAGQADTIQW